MIAPASLEAPIPSGKYLIAKIDKSVRDPGVRGFPVIIVERRVSVGLLGPKTERFEVISGYWNYVTGTTDRLSLGFFGTQAEAVAAALAVRL